MGIHRLDRNDNHFLWNKIHYLNIIREKGFDHGKAQDPEGWESVTAPLYGPDCI